MLSTRQLYRSNNQPASYAALTQFAPEPSQPHPNPPEARPAPGFRISGD
jgi:hypothetical protein